MRKLTYLAILLAALPALTYATTGSWSQTTRGGVLSTGHQIMISSLLKAPDLLPAAAKVTRLSWRIELLSPPPPGLAIKLCNANQCLPLNRLSGTLTPLSALHPVGPFRFIYVVNRTGTLMPALNVVSNQLIINWKQ